MTCLYGAVGNHRTSAMLNSLAVRRCFVNVTTHLARSEACNPSIVAPVVGLLADAREAVR